MNKHEAWQLTREAAELYERYVARYILAPWAPLLVDGARLAEGERVLDVACGTGVVTRAAAKRVGPSGHVVGVDLNPGMLAVARSLPAPAGAPIEWIERSALDLRLPDASFDAVLCQQGLQFFPDKALALRNMRRVLKHGGRLALSVWNSPGLYNSAVGEALARYISNETSVQFLSSRRQAPTRGTAASCNGSGLFRRRGARQRDQYPSARSGSIHAGPFGRNAICSRHRCSTPYDQQATWPERHEAAAALCRWGWRYLS